MLCLDVFDYDCLHALEIRSGCIGWPGLYPPDQEIGVWDELSKVFMGHRVKLLLGFWKYPKRVSNL